MCGDGILESEASEVCLTLSALCCLGSSALVGIILIAMCNNGDTCPEGQKTAGQLLLGASGAIIGAGVCACLFGAYTNKGQLSEAFKISGPEATV